MTGTLLALTLLTILSCVSPVLTLLSLWQIKEWRLDRLVDHLHAEGWAAQLLGSRRPAVFVIVGLFAVLLSLLGISELVFQLMLIPAALMLVGMVQYTSAAQRMPRWTMKARILFVLSCFVIAVFGVTSLYNQAPALLLLAPLFPPFFVALAWGIFLPVDVLMKMRIMGKAAAMRKAQPNLTVIGITGSVGKTTTKELLGHILREAGALATPLHINTEMGVADWLIRTLSKEPSESERILIVEMGAYRIGEIATLCRIAQPSLGVITTAGSQHIALFGSAENIVQGKGELFAALPENGHAFGNKDNKAFDTLKKRCVCPLTSVGTEHGADLVAHDIEEASSGIRFTLEGVKYTVPLFGTHTVTSVLLAIAVARHLGMQHAQIAERLQTFSSIESTFQLKVRDGITVLDDTYNLSPESFRAAIAWAKNQPHLRKILVTEGIIELGNASSAIHRSIALEADQVFDEVYVAHPELLPYFADAFGTNAHTTTDPVTLKEGDLVVLTGRLHPSIIQRFTKKTA